MMAEQEIQEEYKKCLNNPYYFYVNYVRDCDSDGNVIAKELTPDQEKVDKMMSDYLIENVDKPLIKQLYGERFDS